MSESSDPVCFQCGNPVTDPPRIHYLASGEACHHCRDRFVDSLPTLLPGEEKVRRELGEDADHDTYLAPGDAYPEGGHRA
jgi:hypothetical protein